MKKNILLIFVLISILVIGCSKNNDLSTTLLDTNNIQVEANHTIPTTRIIIDMAGKEVEIPYEVHTYVESWAAHNTIDLMLDNQEGMIATCASPRMQSCAWAYLISENLGNALSIEFSESMNLEEIISLNPDVVFGKNENYREMFENIGIPYINCSFNSYETMVQSIQMTADVLGVDAIKVANKYVDYLHERIEWVQKQLASLENDDKLSVIHGYPMYDLSIDGSKTIIDEWINYSGGINVAAEEVQGEIQHISLEQLFVWDPDVIITGSYQEDIDNIMADSAWSNLTAVKNKRVYVNPKGIFMWDRYGIEEALQVQWCASILYPDLFKDFNIEKELKYFYKEFFNYELSDEQIQKIIRHEEP